MSNETMELEETPAIPSKLVIVSTLVIVLFLAGLDAVIPPAGIPLALVAIWLILRFTGGRWAELGLSRPASWKKTVALGIALGMALQFAAIVGLEPLLKVLGIATPDISRFDVLQGNVSMLAVYLTVSWTTAGFGEEVIARGFGLLGLTRLLGGSPRAWWIGLALSSVLFGLGHAYQGPSGMIATGLVGFALGSIYLKSGKNLWMAIFAHGAMDSIAFVALFLGLHP